MKFTRITSDLRQMGGVPCIRSLRIPVATVVGMIADGMTKSEIRPQNRTAPRFSAAETATTSRTPFDRRLARR
jgi:Protein of unknown function (DUF433)